MSRPTLLFVHANGFPAGCYHRFLQGLQPEYRVLAPERLGHHPHYPLGNWVGLTDELLDWLAAQTPEPVHAVGHSLGGVLAFLAALRQPRRFADLVMLDPPLVFGWTGWVVAAAKRLGLMDRITPAGASRGRRARWDSPDQALEHLRQKRLFAAFDPGCLEDYVRFGTRRTADGVELVFDPEREVEIFRQLPHDLHRQPAPLAIPGTVLVASHDSVTRPPDLRRLRRRHRLRLEQCQGSHMFPLEHPGESAAAVHRCLRRMAAHTGATQPSAA